MELKHGYVLIAGIVFSVIVALLHIFLKKRKKSYKDGTKIYNMAFVKDHAYLKRRKKLHRLLSVFVVLSLFAGVIAVSVLVARPYKSKVKKANIHSRDIILCMDVSTTVDSMNESLVDELIDTVNSLKGERFGIIIFNTSPVLLCPLTDDYEFVVEQLENIKTALKVRIDFDTHGIWNDDYFYWNQYISGGTLVGNEQRGSSIIGDGLASTVYHFSNKDKKRTRIVIFTTDNDVYGTEIFDLPEAAELCRENNIIVYGIGTKEMYKSDKKEMQESVELTGGKFYLEEEKETFTEIVNDIQSQSSSLVQGKTYVVDTEFPRAAFIAALCSVMVLFMSLRLLRR